MVVFLLMLRYKQIVRLMLLFRLVRAAAAAKWKLSLRDAERRLLLQTSTGSAGLFEKSPENYLCLSF